MKKGMDEYLAAHGPEKALQHFEAVRRSPAYDVRGSQPVKREIKDLVFTTGEDLLSQDLKAPEPIIEGLLYNGLTILGGRPKSGKSWLALQLAASIVSGSSSTGLRVHLPGRVLYLALEEPSWRTQSRLQQLTTQSDFLGDIQFVYETEPMNEGGLDQLDRHLQAHAAEVVIIDSYLAFSRLGNSKKDIVQADYNSIDALRKLAHKHRCAILLVHHTRKSKEGGSIDRLLGTTGVPAACDGIWILDRQEDGGEATLEITGREVLHQKMNLTWSDEPNQFGWQFTGKVAPASATLTITPERQEILALLATSGPLAPMEIATRLGKPPGSGKHAGTTRVLLKRLRESGLVKTDEEGRYQLPTHLQDVNAAGGA